MIVSISYYDGHKRVVVKQSFGRFSLRNIERRTFLIPTRYSGKSFLTAREFVTHPMICDKDPVLTLNDGNKVRVYQGGASSHLVFEAQCDIDNHDQNAVELRKNLNKKGIKLADGGGTMTMSDDMEPEDFPWDLFEEDGW